MGYRTKQVKMDKLTKEEQARIKAIKEFFWHNGIGIEVTTLFAIRYAERLDKKKGLIR